MLEPPDVELLEGDRELSPDDGSSPTTDVEGDSRGGRRADDGVITSSVVGGLLISRSIGVDMDEEGVENSSLWSATKGLSRRRQRYNHTVQTGPPQ